MKLSIGFISVSKEPLFKWFTDSVRNGLNDGDEVEIIFVDSRKDERAADDIGDVSRFSFRHEYPKPTVWQGKSRITKQDWWAKSSALNSFLCLAKHPFVMCADDRSVLLPGWFARVQAAMNGKYAVCGRYEKRHGMQVVNGVITEPGTVSGEDTRAKYLKDHRTGTIMDCPGEWWFGCLNALPLEWALQLNGYEELMDSLSFEDVIFGLMLKNNGFPIKYDAEFAMVEDRTPEKLGPPMRRTSKERFPHDKQDKGHKALARFGVRKRTEHHWDLRAIRAAVLRGEPFPRATQPTHCWHDGQPIRDF